MFAFTCPAIFSLSLLLRTRTSWVNWSHWSTNKRRSSRFTVQLLPSSSALSFKALSLLGFSHHDAMFKISLFRFDLPEINSHYCSQKHTVSILVESHIANIANIAEQICCLKLPTLLILRRQIFAQKYQHCQYRGSNFWTESTNIAQHRAGNFLPKYIIIANIADEIFSWNYQHRQDYQHCGSIVFLPWTLSVSPVLPTLQGSSKKLSIMLAILAMLAMSMGNFDLKQ